MATEEQTNRDRWMREERALEEAIEHAERRREHWIRTGEWPVGRAFGDDGPLRLDHRCPIATGRFHRPLAR